MRRPRRRPGTGGGDGADDDTSVSSMSIVSTATSVTIATNQSNKIEELRKRCEALKSRNTTQTTPVVQTTVSTPSPRASIASRISPSRPATTPRARMTPTLDTIPSPLKTSAQPAAIDKAQVKNDHLKEKIKILEDKLLSSAAGKSVLQENFNTCTKESHEMKNEVESNANGGLQTLD